MSELLASLGTFVLFCVVILPIHELGHALAARLVGYRVLELTLGSGRTLLSGRLGGVVLRLNLVPLRGITRVAPRPGASWLRLRYWIVIAGGPAAQVLLHLVLRRIVGPEALFRPRPGQLALLAEANLILLALNLIPFKGEGDLASDGYQLFSVPFWQAPRLLAHRLTAIVFEANHELNAGHPAAARAVVERARGEHGLHPTFALADGLVLYRERQLTAARDVWREGLGRATERKEVAVLQNGVAFLDAVLGGEENLREAERLSGEAAAVVHEAAFLNTRGAVLIRLGRAREGLALLGKNLGVMIPQERAYVGALRAMGLFRSGHRDEGLAQLAAVRAIDPRCELLPEVEAAADGPVAEEPAPSQPASPGQEAFDRARFARRWRLQVTAVASVTSIGLATMGTLPWSLLTAIFLGLLLLFHAHRAGIAALAASLLTLAAQHAAGVDLLQRGQPPLPPWGTLLIPALGLAAAWLALRSPPPTSARGTAVTGTALALWSLPTVAIPFLARPGGFTFDLTALVALATVLLISRQREVKALALLPLLLAAAITWRVAPWSPPSLPAAPIERIG